jgi:hypothetical protein
VTNIFLAYKVILKPIWTYVCQLWGTASKNNIKIIERRQNKKPRLVMNADWYIRNNEIDNETGILTVSEEIRNHSRRYQIRLKIIPTC